MKPSQGTDWWIETTTSPLSGAPDAVLIIRLGLAVNALRAQHRFSNAVNSTHGPGGMRDRLWALIQAAAFVREGLNILTGTNKLPGHSSAVKQWAQAGGADRVLAKKIGTLCGGSHPACAVLTRLRNQLAFHWDPTVIAPCVASQASRTRGRIIWAEGRGRTNGETAYRAASDALTNAILPGPNQTASARFKAALPHLTEAMDAMARYFECAIVGWLNQHNASLRRRSQSAKKR